MRNFDLISLLGLLLALIAIVGGQLLEGGNVSSLVQLTAFVIVIGGTLGAVMLQSTLPVFLRGMRMAKWTFVPPALDGEQLIQKISAWSNTARRGGLLALEPAIGDLDDAFAKRGLQMLIDGAERSTMEALADATLAADKVLVF